MLLLSTNDHESFISSSFPSFTETVSNTAGLTGTAGGGGGGGEDNSAQHPTISL
jgi:hypothetical protein